MLKLAVLRPLLYQSRLLFSEAASAQTQTHYQPPVIETGTCIALIKQCQTLRPLKALHGFIQRSHFHLLHRELFLITNLVSQYVLLGSVSTAFSLFSSVSHFSDLFLWNVMIRAFVDNGHFDGALQLYDQMRRFDIKPDNFTLPFVLKACGCLRDVEIGIKVHQEVLDFGYQSDVFVGNSLIAMYGKCDRIDVSRKVFDEMPERNVVTWSAMTGAYAQNGCFEEGLFLFKRMLDERIRPNRVVLLNVMACVRREDDADNICRVVVDNGLDFHQSLQNAAMIMYGRCGRMELARRFFDRILNKDLVSWTSMIEAYAQADLSLEALELFRQMKLQWIIPDSVTFLSVVRACSSLASFQQSQFGIIISATSTIPMELSSIDLKVMYCKDLKGFNFFQKLSVYALVSIISDDPDKKLEHKQQHRTPTDKEGDGNPEWQREMQFDLKGVSFHDCDHLFIHFELRHEGVMFGDKNIGEVRVPCKDLILDSNGGFKFVNYEVRTTDGKPNGVLCFAYKVNGTGFPISHHHHPQTSGTLYSPIDVHSSRPELHSVPPQTSENLYPPINVHTQTAEILYPPISVHSSAPEVHTQTSEILYPSLDVHSTTPQVAYPVQSSPATSQDVQYLSTVSQHTHQENYYPPPGTYYSAPRPPPPPPSPFSLPYLPHPPPPGPQPPLLPPMAHGGFYHPPHPSHFHGWAPEPHMGFYGPSAGHSHSFDHGEASASHSPGWRDGRSSSWNGR
ncbi:hypothetical protein Patl1_02501 [Pistacia atlantica]|uniref:Uncharacterized protein n=1 Tax=Pistacia atlantica TaxID=434234 RepID=A0ACC1C9T2_9ROSI|nr:hypothetical protein Patl1_02501 [Pistacia atlantica]